MKSKSIIFVLSLASILLYLTRWLLLEMPGAMMAEETTTPILTQNNSDITIILDDFMPQPYQGESAYYYNRIGGDRGALGNGVVDLNWGVGQVTATIVSGDWGGVWTSLNHPIRENVPINFSAVCPAQVLPAYQSAIVGLRLKIAAATPGSSLKVELKNENGNITHWSQQEILTGNPQTLSYTLPALPDITSLIWLLENATVGDYVVVDEVALTATMPATDTAETAFVWSYCMLLHNWDADTGLVRDQSRFPSGDFDAIQSTGSLAAATAVAAQLGIVDNNNAVQIVTTISNTLLMTDVIPRYQGLWPHWVKLTPSGTFTIVSNTEWSSVDTAIAAMGLLEAQTALGLGTAGTEAMLHAIAWDDLLLPGGISHGYTYTRTLITNTWDTFGGESWLVGWVYAAATGDRAPIPYCTPPTANGSGFIDELAWLFAPPPQIDCWGTDWYEYRQQAAATQIEYYATQYTDTLCLEDSGLFGLSAGEVPLPSLVITSQIYQPFGVGGQFNSANDGTVLLGAPVAVPHYAGMIASIRPTEAISMWTWLIDQGPFSPLNNVESLMFLSGDACTSDNLRWNQLRGSWNLALQTLGWGRYLAERQGVTPVLWQASEDNLFLADGYNVLSGVPVTAVTIIGPDAVLQGAPASFSVAYIPITATAPVTLTWNNGSVGQTVTYTWPATGTYTVMVTATNQCGQSITQTQSTLVYYPEILLTPDRAGYGNPGSEAVFTHTLHNLSNYTDTLFLTHHSGQNWEVTHPALLELAAGELRIITITVTIPSGTLSDTVDTTLITATSTAVPQISAQVTDTTNVRQVAAIDFAPNYVMQALPGSPVTFTHTLTNIGNYTDTFTLTYTSDLGWDVALSPTLTLAPGQASSVLTQIMVPAGTLSSTVDQVIVMAVSQADAAVQAEVIDEIMVARARELTVSEGSRQTAYPGSTITYTHLITNRGNYTETLTITVNDTLGWEISYPTTITMAGSSHIAVAFVLQIPMDTCGWMHTMTVTIAIQELPEIQVVVTNLTTVNHYCVYLPAVLKP